MRKELVLGIESSCDDTAASVVDRAGNVLSSVVATQTKVHSAFGGVYPEFASRAHISTIVGTVEKALADAGAVPRDLTAIGVTRGPGLIGSLVVGLNTAAGLGLGWGVPVIGINHLRGHLRSADLEERRVKFPAVVLLVSGGHTFLAYMEDFGSIELLGTTRDDSVGEAYDKVGRMLGLGYPAGAAVDRMAKTGNPRIRFPRPMISEGFEFSFSGLKSAVARHVEHSENPVSEDVAASFVEAAMDILLTKCARALKERSPRSLVVVGGVSASPQLRARAKELCDRADVELCLPPLRWSTDNAAMIALATWDYLDAGQAPRPLPQTELPITEY
ncbi:MAG: tRNA (adenosine(37)-N6)-threonylcarbamoyltransferase complex transferase subunit TsaD [Rhizomicrobium sp.]